MRRWIACSLLLLTIVSHPALGDDALPDASLTALKNATVFIKVEKDGQGGSGSGFLVRVDADTGYIVSNHHVVTPVRRIRHITYHPLPRYGRGQYIPPTVREEEIPIDNPSVTVVFSSGEADERSVPGEVVASDRKVDLAVVKVGPVKRLPKPIDLTQSGELRETRAVFALGFPLGQMLATGRGGPAITITKGTITSIRRDEHNEVSVVQIDSDLNPGNSGGPVVDTAGRLVGIAVAKVRDTHIGMAIPPHELSAMIRGRVGDARLELAEARQVQAEVDLVDPLDRIQSVVLYCVAASVLKGHPTPDNLADLKECQKVALKRERRVAVAKFPVDVPANGEISLVYQVAWIGTDGRSSHGERQNFVATAPGLTRSATEERRAAASPDAKSSLTGVKRVEDLPRPEARPAGKVLSDEEIAATVKALSGARQAQKAAETLAGAKPETRRQTEVVQALRTVLSQKDLPALARSKAAKALGVWGSESDADLLIPLVSDENAEMRAEALEALSWLGGEKAVEAVADRIEEPADRARVLKCLQRLGSVAEDTVVGTLLGSSNASLRLDGCRLLKTIGTDKSLRFLQTMSENDGSDNVRQAAVGAMAAIRTRLQSTEK
jgi:Trypsin-like peptidase domain/HEAT repeats